MRALSENGSMRFTLTLPIEQKNWLTEISTDYISQADIVRSAVQLLMDLGWKPDEN